MAYCLFHEAGLIEIFQIPEKQFINYFRALEINYGCGVCKLCVCVCMCVCVCAYVLPTFNLKVDLSHVNVEEFSAELEIAPDIGDSACHILNALLRLRYHDLIVVDDLRLEAEA